ncbi:MAG: flagellar biosynthesis protein FlhA [Phycisphaerae bacterium]|nr:flagellar biosynthesis protein FlhA [Phycisphaerae bacterium]
MAQDLAAAQNGPLAFIARHRGIILPLAVIGLILVIVVPLPPWMLDILLACNITLSITVLLTTLYVNKPLDFSVFPSLLLALTLFRLVLNVASTRLILTIPDRASDASAAGDAAGKVIEAFAQFVAGGNLAVGVIVFAILVIIQFVVITKGATRISEVAARFTLDGMPGKQMAIDADLNAGLITEAEARQRRESISQESDFYGAMDGASKFVRGDAIAGIIITIVNILGGFYVGMVEKGWAVGECLSLFTRLTIGDGLVTQVPSFIISISAGLIVTRSASRSDLGREMISQLTSRPIAMVIAAVFLLLMAAVGLPPVPLTVLAMTCLATAWFLNKSGAAARQRETAKTKQASQQQQQKKPQSPDDGLILVDAMELEIGYGLIRLVDAAQGGDLLDRISMIRRQVALELGIIVPPIRIRDNMRLDPNEYRVRIKGNTVARGEARVGMFLAMDSGVAAGELPGGIRTREPAFGLPAWWIGEDQRQRAEMLNYTVVDASSVLATHLTELIRNHASELLTREEVNKLIKSLKEKAPSVVDEVVPSVMKVGDIQKVLQNLLRERVAVRDLETILETLGDWAPRTSDIDVLTEYVRNSLARSLCDQYVGADGVLRVVTLDPALEDRISAHIEHNERGSFLTMPPDVARNVAREIADAVRPLVNGGYPPVVLTSPQIRAQVKRIADTVLPNLAVLSFNEIVRGVKVESMGMAELKA